MSGRRGFTLLEMIVATTIMAMAIGAAMQSITTSMRNASRLTDHDRSAMLARRKLEELLTERRLPRYQIIEGVYETVHTNGLPSGWRAQVTPFELPPNPGPGSTIMDRIQVEVWWEVGAQRRTFTLDGYRRSLLTNEDIQAGVLLPR